MKSNEHQEISFLIKAFAWFGREADTIIHFREMFGKDPTRKQLAYANLEKYLDDKRAYFKNNWRVRKFKLEREKAKASMRNVPIADPDWRMQQYQQLYERSIQRSLETGNTTRCSDLLVLAAKDAAGAYNPQTKNIIVDNRVQTYNSNMSDEEINKRLARILNQFGVSIPDMPLITKGGTVIESQAEDVEIDEREAGDGVPS